MANQAEGSGSVDGQDAKSELVWVYCLKHPHTGQVCYVGIAIDPWVRFRGHMRDALRGKNQKATWLRSLVPELPSMAVLEQVPKAEILKAEKRWILKFRKDGHPVTNSTAFLPKKPQPKPKKPKRESPGRLNPPGRNPLLGLMTMAQAAEYKEVRHSAVAKAIHDGRLRAWEFGGVYLIPRKELDAWQPVRGRGRQREKPNE